jgi:hypothetical protein
MRPMRPTLWIPQPNQLECNADDKQFEDCGAARACCVTPLPVESDAPHQNSRSWAIDRKMQHEWREDLLRAKRWN